MPEQPTGPRMIKHIVCGYRLGSLPGEWLQTWRRLDRLIHRSGFKIKVTLDTLEAMPDTTDILVVPPELRDKARDAAPGAILLITTASNAPAAFADLVRRLEAGTEITAEREEPDGQTRPRIVTYRGYERID